MPITIRELAIYRLEQQGETFDPDALHGGNFAQVGLEIMGGCAVCNATLAAYNACPSETGYWMCLNGCIEDQGFDTVEEANSFIFGEVG